MAASARERRSVLGYSNAGGAGIREIKRDTALDTASFDGEE